MGKKLRKANEKCSNASQKSPKAIKWIYCQTFNKHRCRIIIYRFFSLCGNKQREETEKGSIRDKRKKADEHTATEKNDRKKKHIDDQEASRKTNPSPVNNLHVVENVLRTIVISGCCVHRALSINDYFSPKKKNKNKNWQQAIGRSTRNTTKYVLLHFCTITCLFSFSFTFFFFFSFSHLCRMAQNSMQIHHKQKKQPIKTKNASSEI